MEAEGEPAFALHCGLDDCRPAGIEDGATVRLLSAAVIVFLGLILAVPICVGLANAITGNPMNYSYFLISGIVAVAWVVGRLVR